ncbi:MAG: hypothetical protein D6704_09355 [Nitrospirae bacterium]|nr:MAG: hypothetical protein D6704_09355 [Nitrospirota bacterium]
METQLADRYLRDNQQCQHGLYVVAWFRCDQWDEADSRSEKTPQMACEEVQRRLDTQARQFSEQKDLTLAAFVLNTALR